MPRQELVRSAEALVELPRFRGGVEHTVAGCFEAFGTEDDHLVNLGTWPTWGAAADFYAQWSASHPRPERPQPSRAEMLAEIQRVRRSLESQRECNSRAYELRVGS